MAACANSVALRIHEAEEQRRHRRVSAWTDAYRGALARFPGELGDDLLLEVVSELGEDDPPFDSEVAVAFQALGRVRAGQGGPAQLTTCYAAIGRVVVDWIDHYGHHWAEREADLETGQ